MRNFNITSMAGYVNSTFSTYVEKQGLYRAALRGGIQTIDPKLFGQIWADYRAAKKAWNKARPLTEQAMDQELNKLLSA